MRARYYDPQTGQFLTRDPLEQLTEQAYQYAGDDPVNAVDPLGLFSIHISLPSLQDVSDAAAGFGDSATFGLTSKIRQALGVDNVDYCSAAYAGGGVTGGIAVAMAVPEERLLALAGRAARSGEAAGEVRFIGFRDGPPAVVPEGATGPVVTRGPGVQYVGGAGGPGLDSRVSGVRIMDSTPHHPGRVVYMNEEGQAVNPRTGRTVSKSDPWAHIPR